MKSLRMLPFATLLLCATVANAQSPWQPVLNVPNIGAGAMALLTDGSVMVHDESGNAGTWGNWWKLQPDANGDYADGTWTQMATMPSNYGPLYFAIAVLPDGRMLTEGGEYNFNSYAWTTLGAIYDPIANAWTPVKPPPAWSTIGDAQTAILNNGTLLLANCCSTQQALFHASNLTWTATGSHKFDWNDEEGWSLLPGGKVLTVDAYYRSYNAAGTNSEIYDPNTGSWSSAGSTIVQLWDSAKDCGGSGSASYEVGPMVLRPDGTVFATGANKCGAGHTAIYNVSAGAWTAGPDFNGNLDIADGPSALEPNGKVLMMTSPGVFHVGSVFFEWDGSNLTQVSGPPNAGIDSSYEGHMLVLPTGQILFTDFSSDVELYNSTGTYPGIAPSFLLATSVLTRGQTITLMGSRFNGASQAGAQGDDYQAATNYPIVRFTNVATGHVFYGRTHDHNAMPVGYPGPSFTKLDIPSGMETGLSYLEVIANGIPSAKHTVGIR